MVFFTLPSPRVCVLFGCFSDVSVGLNPEAREPFFANGNWQTKKNLQTKTPK